VWTGGNDDDEEVLLEVAAEAGDSFRYVEEQTYDADVFQVVSVGYSNPTPFGTSREITEDELRLRLQAAAAQVSPGRPVIANLHAPPFGCGVLDLVGNPDIPGEARHVGSHAVREFIEMTQPAVALVGHIHEGKGVVRVGKTDVFNPGSDYNAGVLQAFIMRITPAGVLDFVHISR
jgi:Icc-related predicted phosphoesterase